LQEPPKKERKNYSPPEHIKVTYLGSRNPWTDRYKVL